MVLVLLWESLNRNAQHSAVRSPRCQGHLILTYRGLAQCSFRSILSEVFFMDLFRNDNEHALHYSHQLFFLVNSSPHQSGFHLKKKKSFGVYIVTNKHLFCFYLFSRFQQTFKCFLSDNPHFVGLPIRHWSYNWYEQEKFFMCLKLLLL